MGHRRRELERAQTRTWDARIASAIQRAEEFGIAEYLASGPDSDATMRMLGMWGSTRVVPLWSPPPSTAAAPDTSTPPPAL
ncbi:hypothetical protein Acor_39940 [Acrocarpospora corrugata]|uniref:Uncharacterized protein n=1 Tax=Acrocarpospora corrugata TaxID=35763 RepID=A0A5M3W0X0_9ACTN|nr:hypothetical protein Acor_39940 [Acrocarpospora corrugata]